MMTRKARVRRRLLTTAAALYMLAIGGGIGYYVGAYTTATEAIEADTVYTHHVKSGETLWDIARPIADAKGEDIRKVIYQIKVDNELEMDPVLELGQKLVIRY